MKPISINIPNLKKTDKELISIQATTDELSTTTKLRHNVYIMYT